MRGKQDRGSGYWSASSSDQDDVQRGYYFMPSWMQSPPPESLPLPTFSCKSSNSFKSPT